MTERKALIEVSPGWYTTTRGLSDVSYLLGFTQKDDFLRWIYGQEITTNMANHANPIRILDLGSGSGNLTYDLNRDAKWRAAPLSVHSCDPYLNPTPRFGAENDIFEIVLKNHIKDDPANLQAHFSDNCFDRIVASASYGLYAETQHDFEDQTAAIASILKENGLLKFVLLPAQATFLSSSDSGEERPIIDVSQINTESNFLLENPYGDRWKRYPMQCLAAIAAQGLEYCLYPTLDRKNPFFVVCEVTKSQKS